MEENTNPNQNVLDYIKYYLTVDNPQFAVLINGKWGSGKTYFIKNELNLFIEQFKNNEEDSIVLKPIYISLYGVSNTNEINVKIKEALSPFLYSKPAKVLTNIFFGAVKTATNINFDVNGDGKSDGKVSFDINSIGLLKNSNSKIKGNKVLVFDDLERCSIKTSELFGYINEFVEHYNCKVILLSDEERIDNNEPDQKKSYKEFKEKLVGQTFTIQADVTNAISTFISSLKGSPNEEFLQGSINLITSTFTASKIENLRILRQAIVDFDRFTKQFDDFITKNKEYNRFLHSLLVHFLLVYLEYKSGNISISEIGIGKLDSHNEIESNIISKYYTIIEKLRISRSTSVLQYDIIIGFIINGYSNTKELNDSVSQNEFFREMENWDKLWNWSELEDTEFEEVYKTVLHDFDNNKYDNPYILLHVVMTLLSLIDKGFFSGEKSVLMMQYKNQLGAVLEQNICKVYSPIGNHAWGKSYINSESKEFMELREYSNERFSKHKSQNKDDYLKQIFEGINDTNISHIFKNLDKPMPDASSTYAYGCPILSTVDGSKLGDALLKLKNKNLSIFYGLLRSRYFPEEIYSNGYLEPFNSQDKDCLIALKERLETEKPHLPKIKKYRVEELSILLGNIIDKLSLLENSIGNSGV